MATFNLGDLTKYLTQENIALIGDAMKVWEEAKPLVIGRLKYWLNNNSSALETIVESLTEERAKELAKLLAKRKERS